MGEGQTGPTPPGVPATAEAVVTDGFERVSDRIEVIRDEGQVVSVALGCHLCSQVKQGPTPERVLYELAFHYDRRHKGWTNG